MKWRKFLQKKPFYLHILILFVLFSVFLFTKLILLEKSKEFSFLEILYFSIMNASFVFLISTSAAFMSSLMCYQYEREMKGGGSLSKKYLYSFLFSLIYSLVILVIGYPSFTMPRKENQYLEEWIYTSIEVFLRDPIFILGLIIVFLLTFSGFYFLVFKSFSNRIYRIEIVSSNRRNEVT